MIKTFLFILLSILISGCDDAKEIPPDDKMVAILTDMLILDELIVKYGASNPDLYRDSLKMMILDRHDLNTTAFDSLMTEVQKDLKNYHVLQSKVDDSLDSLKKEVELKSMNKPSRDTIQ